MSTPSLFSPEPRKPNSLAKLTAILAVIFVIGFGLCTRNFLREGTAASVEVISGTIALICLVALIVIGFIAIFRSRT